MKVAKYYTWIVVASAALAAAPDDGPPAAPAAVVPRAVVVAPPERPAFRTILLDGGPSSSVAPLQWKLLEFDPEGAAGPAATVPPLLVFDKAGKKAVYACILDPSPGRYYVSAVAVGTDNNGDDIPDVDVAITAIRVAPEPVPAPPPLPEPTPTPTPEPATPAPRPLHVSLIYDRDAMTPELAAIRGDDQASATIAAAGGRWRTYDVASPDVARYNFKAVVDRAGGPPCVIVQDATGRVVGTYKGFHSIGDILGYVRSTRAP